MERLEFANQRGPRRRHQLGTALPGVRPLHGQHGQIAALGQLDGKALGLRLQPGQVLVAGGGVDHQAIAAGGAVDDQVVDHPALGIQHDAVQRLPQLGQARHIVGQHPAQILSGLHAGDIDHSHVRDIEDPAVAAHLMMLLDLRTVVQRHVPAAEVDHLGAKRHVQVVEGGALSHGISFRASNGPHCSRK
ncbi:hypothetical protein D3C80_1239010 [compost metagenome]